MQPLLEVGDHQRQALPQRHLWLPVQVLLGLRRMTDGQIFRQRCTMSRPSTPTTSQPGRQARTVRSTNMQADMQKHRQTRHGRWEQCSSAACFPDRWSVCLSVCLHVNMRPLAVVHQSTVRLGRLLLASKRRSAAQPTERGAGAAHCLSNERTPATPKERLTSSMQAIPGEAPCLSIKQLYLPWRFISRCKRSQARRLACPTSSSVHNICSSSGSI
jgi:hypothetical protein